MKRVELIKIYLPKAKCFTLNILHNTTQERMNVRHIMRRSFNGRKRQHRIYKKADVYQHSRNEHIVQKM